MTFCKEYANNLLSLLADILVPKKQYYFLPEDILRYVNERNDENYISFEKKAADLEFRQDCKESWLQF